MLWEAAKVLKVYRDRSSGRERVWFDRVEVEAFIFERKTPKKTRKTTLKYRTKSRLSARCFELFRRGLSWQDVVIETKADPERVLELLETYKHSPEQLEEKRLQREDERRWRQEAKEREWKDFRERMAKVQPPSGVNREQMAEIMKGVLQAIAPLLAQGASTTGAGAKDDAARSPVPEKV